MREEVKELKSVSLASTLHEGSSQTCLIVNVDGSCRDGGYLTFD